MIALILDSSSSYFLYKFNMLILRYKALNTCGTDVSYFLCLSFFFLLVEKSKAKSSVSESKSRESDNIVAQTFTFSELATATRNFRKECLIGEGGFGRVYKGYLASTSQVPGFLIFTF